MQFIIDAFQRSHVRAPRGCGMWGFDITCETPEQRDAMLAASFEKFGVRAEQSAERPEDLRLWSSCPYGEAKRRVREFLRAHAANVDAMVCP